MTEPSLHRACVDSPRTFISVPLLFDWQIETKRLIPECLSGLLDIKVLLRLLLLEYLDFVASAFEETADQSLKSGQLHNIVLRHFQLRGLPKIKQFVDLPIP